MLRARSSCRTQADGGRDPVTIDVVEHLPVRAVPLGSLLSGNSPRLSGTNRQHILTLVQAERPWPPILVHHPTMRVIDGAHRVEAARLRGDGEIEARLFDGPEDTAFVLAVRANVTHGLPLSLSDRTVAAARILASYPEWSDRAIARSSGLAATTVGAIRRRVTVHSDQLNSRLGRDGRRRPVNAALARRQAVRFIRANPGASLRNIAEEAGISTATARDVRRRLADGLDPVPARLRKAELKAASFDAARPVARDYTQSGGASGRPPKAIVQLLRRDPALRSSEAGRALLRSLTTHIHFADESGARIDDLPPHSHVLALEAARGLAQLWTRFADDLEERVHKSGVVASG